MMGFVSERRDSMKRKGENAHNQHFPVFHHIFKMHFLQGHKTRSYVP